MLAGDGSLWVAWLNRYVIKDQNFWKFVPNSSTSWSTRKILKIRTDALQFSSDSNAIKDIWDDIRPKSQKVPWHNLLWFPLHIPKHCLIVWMTIQDRLPTRDRLQNMGINAAALCVNCSNYPKTRNHLFTDCSLEDRLWNIILNVNGMNASHLTWNDMVYRAITS
ncbi:uncharacterized protein LOC120144057 [Hibiscus syriacus]|uniref:uncharacterized protein LOC120144057 n=1 Tax=Hibiscus syriacus TaxID=106335 RepID=UPI001923CDFF|nr:uncharacterized protein LOC120144057 [Hibiscus syriacus]